MGIFTAADQNIFHAENIHKLARSEYAGKVTKNDLVFDYNKEANGSELDLLRAIEAVGSLYDEILVSRPSMEDVFEVYEKIERRIGPYPTVSVLMDLLREPVAEIADDSRVAPDSASMLRAFSILIVWQMMVDWDDYMQLKNRMFL